MKLSIIIPIHNEEPTLTTVLNKLLKIDIEGWQKEIIAVNDGSTDNTAGILAKWQASGEGRLVVTHSRNLGKGTAVRTALSRASGDHILIQDADLEYDPANIPSLLSVLDSGPAAVFGDRGIKSYPERGFHYVVGAKLLTWFFNVLYGAWLHDLYTGYKLLPAGAVRSFNLQSCGFEFEAEVACKLRKSGVKIIEVPISYKPRNKAAGKHIRALDAFRGLLVIIRIRFGKF